MNTDIENDPRFVELAATDPNGAALVSIAISERAEDDERAEFERTGRADRGRRARWLSLAIERATASVDAWIGARAAGAAAIRRGDAGYVPRWLGDAVERAESSATPRALAAWSSTGPVPARTGSGQHSARERVSQQGGRGRPANPYAHPDVNPWADPSELAPVRNVDPAAGADLFTASRIRTQIAAGIAWGTQRTLDRVSGQRRRAWRALADKYGPDTAHAMMRNGGYSPDDI